MDMSFTPEELAFRDEVRALPRDNLPPRLAEKVAIGRASRQGRHGAWHAAS